jgi:hypothetical protein
MCHQKTGRTWIPCPSGWQNIGSVGLGNLIRFRKLDCSPKHPANSWEFQLACAKLGPNTESVKSMCVFADKSDCWEMDVVQQTCLKGSGVRCLGVWHQNCSDEIRAKDLYSLQQWIHPPPTTYGTRNERQSFGRHLPLSRLGSYWFVLANRKNM